MRTEVPIIEVIEASKSYAAEAASVQVLDGVTLRIERGEFASIMGPSGSGKSTLLQIIGGLDLVDVGAVRVGGRDLASMRDGERSIFRRRQVGFVFQFFNLLPTLTAEENVALPLLLDGKRAREVGPRVEAILRRLGLWARRDHRPHALSGGEMQRVAIARAVVVGPLVVLADEPTGSLDSRTGAEILALLREVVDRDGVTVVMVTHDPNAAAYGDRVATLIDGRIVNEGQSRQDPRAEHA